MIACHIFRRLLLGAALLPLLSMAQPNFVRPAGYTADIPLNEINIHAYRHFHKRWPMVATEVWNKTGEGYMVSFMEQGIRNRAFFDFRGSFLCAMKYYSGVNVPKELTSAVKKKYPDYLIRVVTEITDGNKTCYFLKIENSRSVKTLSFNDGKLEVNEDVTNGG